MKSQALVIVWIVCPLLCLVSTLWASIPSPIPLEDLVAQSERILVAQALDWEEFDDGRYSYTRTHLRVLWDITAAAGKGGELDFEDGEMSVVDWTGVMGGGRILGLAPAAFWKGEVVVVCLGRIPYESGVEVYKDLVGEWKVVRGMEGKRGFNPKGTDTQVVRPMLEVDWQALVDYATELLTLLGVEPSRAETQSLENLLPLRPPEDTSVPMVIWGDLKARFLMNSKSGQ